jgi:hypothetical protein
MDQAVNGDDSKEYLRSQLGPKLKPGDIVIGDNRPAHKAADQLWQPLDTILDETQAEECRNYFENAGYASKQ